MLPSFLEIKPKLLSLTKRRINSGSYFAAPQDGNALVRKLHSLSKQGIFFGRKIPAPQEGSVPAPAP